MPPELLDELKRITNGFICVTVLQDKTRIFVLDTTPILLFWDGVLICKGKNFRKKLEENEIIREYLQ